MNIVRIPRRSRVCADRAEDLHDGQYRNLSGKPNYFSTAYFHRLEDLRDEATAAGFEVKSVFGVEGPAWILPDVAARPADLVRRETLLRAARMIELEEQPGITAASAHLLAVARNPA